jgi:hypothetical protein
MKSERSNSLHCYYFRVRKCVEQALVTHALEHNMASSYELVCLIIIRYMLA